jgi:LysR family transcriptional repressor of citA
MEVAHLRAFVAVATHGGFRRAADRLYLSQPTVSAQVAALERELGFRLFERKGRRSGLTPEAEQLLPYALRLLALHDEAVRRVGAWRLGLEPRLRLVASIFVASSVLPGALRRLAADYPRLDLSLRTAFSREVLAAIAADEADLGFCRLPPDGVGTDGRLLWREPVVAVVPATWMPTTMAAALQQHPLLTHNHPGYWDRLLAQIASLGFHIRTFEVRQVEVTRRLIEEACGWSFLPRSAVSDLVGDAGRLRELPPLADLALPHAETWAVWPRGRAPAAAASRLVDLVAEAARRMGLQQPP